MDYVRAVWHQLPTSPSGVRVPPRTVVYLLKQEQELDDWIGLDWISADYLLCKQIANPLNR